MVALLESYLIAAYWGSRKESCDQCTGRVLACLTDLSSLDQRLAHWYPIANSRKAALKRPVSVDQASIAALLAAGRNRTDFGAEIIESLGYNIDIWNGDQDNTEITFSASCGIFSTRVVNSVVIRIPKCGPNPGFSLARQILTSLAYRFLPDWGFVGTNLLQRTLPSFDIYSPRAGWVTYIADRVATIHGIPSLDCERVGDIGTLIIATRDQFTMDNPDHVRRVTSLATSLERLASFVEPPERTAK